MARILLVEDDTLLREMLCEALTHGGHIVFEAGDGKEAIELFPQVGADLVITDIVMPEKEGLSLLIEIRKLSPSVKVVAMSGGGHLGPENSLRTALHLGAAKVLTKPFSVEVLLAAIRELQPDIDGSTPEMREGSPA